MVAECLRQDGYSPDRPEELSIASEKSDPDGKDFIKKEEILVVDTRKSSLSAIEASGMDDDSPLLTDFTTSSITYVSDRIDSSSFELMVGDTSLDFLKVGITAGFVASDDKKHDVQSPGSCMSFTTTTSENIESITHDVEKLMFTGGSLYPEAPTEYERSVSLSDNAASDYSNESATKYNLPYDTESDGHEPVASMARLKTLKSREGPIELKHVKPTKLMSVDHRHESASPQSDITEYTESVSYVDSIIDSTNYESALKIETSEVTQSPEEEVEIKEQPNLKTAEHELKRVSDKYPTRTVEAKTMIEPIESTQVKRRPKSKATVTKVSLQKQTPIDISKRSAKSVDIRASSGETTRLSETKSAIVSSRGTTTTRTHGYMQSTLSRDQKVLRPLNLADSTHSSPSKSSYRSYSASASATLQTSNSSAVHSIERKIKSTKDTHSVKSGVQEQQPKPPNFSVGAKKETKESTSSTAKTISARSTSSTVSGASTSISHRASRSTTISARKLSEKSDRKEPAVVKKSDKEQANMVTKSTLPAAVKTSKDRVNKSLIPVKVQGKRDSTPSPNKTPKSKSKKETAPKTIEAKMSKHIEKLEQTTDKKETTVVQLITKSVPRVTNTARKESAKHATDDVYRCKSAMHYSYKDAVTFDHAEVPSSLPSSPSRLNKSSSNSTNVLTSEVFTRTIDSSKSIEVIYKQPSTSHELYRRVNEYRYNDIDMTFIETTDSSLSDSIALPSSSSEQESDAANKLKQSGSPGSPKQTSSSSAVTTMTTLTNKKDQHPSPHVRPSKPTSAGKRARTHSPAEPKYRKSDIWSRTEPPASSQELPDTSEDSDMYYYHHQQYQLQHQQQQQQQHQLPPMIGHADRRLTTSLDGIVLESCISPILDFRASTPPRMKYKFDYDSSMFTDTFTERDDALQTSAKLEETDTQLQTEINMPMQAPRLQTITVEAGPVEDASEASASATNASTNIADATTSAAADAATVSFVSMVAVTTSVETKELTTTTTSSAESAVASSVIAREEHSTSITSTEPEKPSDSSSCEGQPVPKPRTSISSRTDTATRSSLLESFEHQDSIEQYPEPVVQPTESDRFRQGSIASDDLSHVAQKDSSEMVTSEEDISTGAKFFIGECSSDIITRTTADKRSEYAFDNDGYTFSQDSQGTEDDSQRNAFEAYQQQIKQEDGFTLDSLKEMDMEMKSATKPPVVHSPVAPLAQSTSVESTQVEQTEATTTDSVAQSLQMTIDELAIEKTLEEVKESLDAVQEELEAVTDGTPIKQSPSEFEFKILPSTRYVQDPIYETNQEEAMAVSTATSAAITTTTIVSDSAPVEPEPKTFPTPPPIKIDEAGSGTGGSSDSSQAKLDVSPRMRKGPHGTQVKGSRWSATDVDSSGESHYQSFEHTDSSRPHSSDIENVMPYASSEYETALDHSMVRTSTGTEYHSAASTLNSYQVSSHDSMKSFDSESSGNLASIESEATETLVPSTMDVDFDSSDAALIHDDSEDDLRDKLLLLDDREELSSATSSIPIAMKRSHEMDFAELAGGDSMGGDDQARQLHEELPDEKLLSSSIGTARDLVESMQASSMEDVKTEGADEMKLGTSMEDGSILSISLSSASNLETIMENLSEKTAAQNVPTHAEIGLDAVTPSTSGAVGFIGDITLTSTVLTEGDVNFLNTQATTEIFELAAGASTREEGEETVRKRGHKRTESTAIISGKFMAEMGENRDSIESQDESLSQEASKQSSSERDETRDESSDSDYDRYESEYARSFRAPVVQPKKKDKKAADVFEKDFGELDRRNSFSPSQSVIETIVEDVHAEIEQSDEAQRIMASKSQRLQEYRESSTHNIPDIHVTEDIAADSASLELEDVVKETSTPAPSTQPSEPVATSSVSTVDEVKKSEAAPSTSRVTEKQTSVQYAKQEEYQLTEEQYHELIEQKYKAKLADSTTKYGFDADDKDDSAGSDSFEMLEQPDISDEFVIVEEVAREAHEFDSEGKSVAIKPTKIEKKHDEDVEKMLVKSAPAHTNAGSLYAANMRDDMMYEFEESPPTGGEDVDAAAGVTMDLMNNGFPLEESKRWVEMQLAETQNFRYPYEDRLEDIKEEDTDFEVGSSRIGSIKDSFSSTPDYDLLAKRMASREHDDISMSSLQEFENLEHVISLENRKMQQGSQDSLSNGSFTRRFVQRGAHGDDISLSSLKEFEGLENACIEAHLIEIKAKEEAALLLSRSDESNKSDRSNGAKRSPPRTGGPVAPGDSGNGQSVGGGSKGHVLASTTTTTTTILGGPSDVTTVKVEKRTSSDVSRDSLSGATTTTTTITTISHESQVRQALEEEDSSHLLTVSSDSLDGTKAPKVTPSARDTLPSAHSSSDSLDINNRNVDVMTSSIDSIEFSKTGIATTRSSQSDSIEHMLGQQQPHRSDSTDSIEAHQQQLQHKLLQQQQQQSAASQSRTLSDAKRDSLESLACSSDNQSGFSSPTKSAHGTQRGLPEVTGTGVSDVYQPTMQLHTQAIPSASVGGAMQKDISADSLTGPDAAFLTSTESLETSSTATNATYQNETDSQMSSSVTSCDSITMVDTVVPHGTIGDFDVFGSSAVGFGGSTMTTSMSAAYASVTGSFGSSSTTTANVTSSSTSQQQQVFRSSHVAGAVSSSTVTSAVSSSTSAYRMQQQQMMGEIELLSSEMFPGDIAFDDVKETAKERMQSKSTEKED
uniref:Uncharacterized protein n=1 Tax=Anopheles atroparvus TaxID=41427 RepID=A0AAG5CRU0_ANOAO